jgi:hypothetical protein
MAEGDDLAPGPSRPTASPVRYQALKDGPATSSSRSKHPPQMVLKEGKFELALIPCRTADADTIADRAIPKPPPNMHLPKPDLPAPQPHKRQPHDEYSHIEEAYDRAFVAARIANERCNQCRKEYRGSQALFQASKVNRDETLSQLESLHDVSPHSSSQKSQARDADRHSPAINASQVDMVTAVLELPQAHDTLDTTKSAIFPYTNKLHQSRLDVTGHKFTHPQPVATRREPSTPKASKTEQDATLAISNEECMSAKAQMVEKWSNLLEALHFEARTLLQRAPLSEGTPRNKAEGGPQHTRGASACAPPETLSHPVGEHAVCSTD